MLVKICGFKTAGEAALAARAGADFVGVLVDVADSPHSISSTEAAKIISFLSYRTKAAVLTWLSEEKELLGLVQETNPALLHLVRETTPSALGALKKEFPHVMLAKTIGIGGEREALSQARKYAGLVDYLMLDTRVGSQMGGTGKTHDWAISKKIIAAVDVPVFVAGGLSASNVSAAIRSCSPAGVDVSTGVEKSGVKNFKLMREFVKTAKAGSPKPF